LQADINNSPQVQQSEAYQAMANQHVEQGPVLQALWGAETLGAVAGYVGATGRAIGSGIASGVSTAGNTIASGISTAGQALASGAAMGISAMGSRLAAVGSGIASGVSTAGQAIVSNAAAGLNAATARLPAMSEQSKERFDPRRWRLNPYNLYHNRQESGYENTHGRYHSQERHGAAHTLRNIHMLTQARPGRPARNRDSAMENIVHPGRAIPQSPLSGRFATPAWQTYSREQAILHATANLPAGITFPAGAPPDQIPANNYHTFSIEYQGSPAGLSVSAAGPQTAIPVHFVRVGIQHDPLRNRAWLIQHFPQTTAVAPSAELTTAETEMAAHKRLRILQQSKWKRKPHLKTEWLKTERALLTRIAEATQRIPNHTIPYNQIPVF